MDLHEYILIITSVVYALALAQILSGVGRLIQTEANVRWFLPHSVWIAYFFTLIPLAWWAGWEFRDLDWVFPTFLYTFITPVFFYFATSLIIPQRIEEGDVDLEQHFLKIRKPALLSVFVAMFAQFADGPILSNEPIWFPARILQLVGLCALLGGAFASGRRIQTVLSIGLLSVTTYNIITRFWVPA